MVPILPEVMLSVYNMAFHRTTKNLQSLSSTRKWGGRGSLLEKNHFSISRFNLYENTGKDP
jgi:hypothetical protein